MTRVSEFCFAFLLVAVTSTTLSAQQSIYMAVDPIKGDQAAPHTGEFKLNSYSAGASNTAAVGGTATGAIVGKAAFTPGKVSMRFVPASSALFYRSLAAGTRLPSIEIRFYNSTRMFYKTVYEDVLLTNVTTEASDEAVQQIEFAYSRVRWFASSDVAGVNPPVQVGCWDIAAVKSC